MREQSGAFMQRDYIRKQVKTVSIDFLRNVLDWLKMMDRQQGERKPGAEHRYRYGVNIEKNCFQEDYICVCLCSMQISLSVFVRDSN